MKINIWIRLQNGRPTMRVEGKWENLDTPTIQRYGAKLMKALEGSCGDDDDEDGKK